MCAHVNEQWLFLEHIKEDILLNQYYRIVLKERYAPLKIKTHLNEASYFSKQANMSVSLRWPVECCQCSKRSWHMIRRYPENKKGVRKLVGGDITCPTSCPGSMVLRKYEEKRFRVIYSTEMRSLNSRRIQFHTFNDS